MVLKWPEDHFSEPLKLHFLINGTLMVIIPLQLSLKNGESMVLWRKWHFNCVSMGFRPFSFAKGYQLAIAR